MNIYTSYDKDKKSFRSMFQSYFATVGKLTWWHQSGSLTPWSHTLSPVFCRQWLRGCVTAEITSSTVHAPHKVLAWLQASVCGTPVWASPSKPWLPLHRGYVGATSWLCYESATVTSWLCCSGCISQERGCVMTAVPAGENKHVCSSTAPRASLQPLSSRLVYPGSSGQRGQCDSKTTGVRSRMKNSTTGVTGRCPAGRGAWGSTGWRKPVATPQHVVLCGCDPPGVGSHGRPRSGGRSLDSTEKA